MSLIFGIVLLVASGWAVLYRLKVRLPFFKQTLFATLLGFFIQSIWMFGCDLVNVQFSQPVLSVLNLALIVLLADLESLKKYDYKKLLSTFINELKHQLTRPDLGTMVFGFALAGLVYLIGVKGLYWPTSEHDAIGTFDKLGIWFAVEGKIHVSLYDEGLQGAGGVYPPLFPCSIAYCYLYGAENPKVVSLIFYLVILGLVFASIRKFTTNFSAAFFTLLLAWSPEFFSHAALLLSNIPSTAYVAASAISLFVWYRKNEQSYFTLSCLMIAGALWLRSDLIAFAFAGLLFLALAHSKLKSKFYYLTYTASFIIPLVVWNLFLKYNIGIQASDRIGGLKELSFEKTLLLLKYVWAYVFIGQQGSSPPGYFLYGIAFLLPLAILLANFKNLKTQKPFEMMYFLAGLMLYSFLFLIVDEQKQDSLQSLMESSFKRGLFCFLPLAVFYAATSKVTVDVFRKIENYRTGDSSETLTQENQ